MTYDFFNDASEGLWRAEQVKYVMSQVYEFEYPRFRHRELFPVDFAGNEGAGSVSYETMDKFGSFKIISGAAQDLPDIDIYMQEKNFPVKLLGGRYRITNEDFRKARLTGKNVSTMKANAAREAHLDAENKIVWFGSEKHNIKGILNNAQTIEVVIPADGGTSKKDWADKIEKPQLILRDLSLIASASAVITNEVEQPDTMIIASRAWRVIKDLAYGTNADKTVLNYFQSANPNITSVVALPELNGAGSDGSDLVLCYRRSADRLVLSIPMEFQPSTTYIENLSEVIPNEAKTAGIILIRPLSVAYAKVSSANAGRTVSLNPDNVARTGASAAPATGIQPIGG